MTVRPGFYYSDGQGTDSFIPRRDALAAGAISGTSVSSSPVAAIGTLEAGAASGLTSPALRGT